MGGTLLTILQNIVTLLTGSFEALVLTIVLIGSCIWVMIDHHWGRLWIVVAVAAIMVSVPYIVNTIFGV